MLAEHERLQDAHDILLVLGVVVFQLLQDAGLDQALLVEALLVAKDLECYHFLLLVVKALEDLTKGTFADAFLHLESVSNVIVHLADVLALLVIEASVLGAVGRGERLGVVFALEDVQVVDLVVLEDLGLLVVEQVLAQIHHYFAGLHWELDFEGPLLIVAEEGLPCDG